MAAFLHQPLRAEAGKTLASNHDISFFPAHRIAHLLFKFIAAGRINAVSTL
jgi:hypothetical protein